MFQIFLYIERRCLLCYNFQRNIRSFFMPEINSINREEIFKKIKKNNGERNAQKFRDLFDIPNIVDILEFAGRNEAELDQVHKVLMEIYKPKDASWVFTKQDPLTLLDQAGYKAWYVKNEQEQNAIGGYFRSQKAVDYGLTGGQPRTNIGNPENGELLCTIYQNLDYGAKRFNDYYVIHAVKKEVLGDDKLPESQWHIKPSRYPQREDEYGRSVISIQIAKTGGFISIKNRYNHTVIDPDNTFDSNPDNIIQGLSNSLKSHFNVEFTSTNTPLPQKFRFVNDRVIRYNFERNNVYIGPDYYFSGSDITKLNNDYELILDYNILDIRTGKVRSLWQDQFGYDKETLSLLNGLFEHKKIKIQTNKNQKIIFADGVHVATVENGQIVELNLQDITELDDNVLSGNEAIKKLIAPKLQKTGKDFLTCNEALTELDLPELVSMGSYSLRDVRTLISIKLPKAKSIGHLWIPAQHDLKELYVPELPDEQLEQIYQNADTKLKFMLATNKILKSFEPKFKAGIDKKFEKLTKKTKELYGQFEQDAWEVWINKHRHDIG